VSKPVAEWGAGAATCSIVRNADRSPVAVAIVRSDGVQMTKALVARKSSSEARSILQPHARTRAAARSSPLLRRLVFGARDGRRFAFVDQRGHVLFLRREQVRGVRTQRYS
jgi:hypothetical protein